MRIFNRGRADSYAFIYHGSEVVTGASGEHVAIGVARSQWVATVRIRV